MKDYWNLPPEQSVTTAAHPGATEGPISRGYGTPTRLGKNMPQEDVDRGEPSESFMA
jgi:hypothetical protein